MKSRHTGDGSRRVLDSLPNRTEWMIRLAGVTYQRGCAVLEEKEPLCILQEPNVVEMMK